MFDCRWASTAWRPASSMAPIRYPTYSSRIGFLRSDALPPRGVQFQQGGVQPAFNRPHRNAQRFCGLMVFQALEEYQDHHLSEMFGQLVNFGMHPLAPL